MNITVSNSCNPSRVYVRLCKHGERFLLLIQTAKSFFSAKNLVISVYRRDDFAFFLWHCFLFCFVLFFLLVDVKTYTKTLRRTYSGVFLNLALLPLHWCLSEKKNISLMFQKMSKYHCFSTEAYSSSTRENYPMPHCWTKERKHALSH